MFYHFISLPGQNRTEADPGHIRQPIDISNFKLHQPTLNHSHSVAPLIHSWRLTKSSLKARPRCSGLNYNTVGVLHLVPRPLCSSQRLSHSCRKLFSFPHLHPAQAPLQWNLSSTRHHGPTLLLPRPHTYPLLLRHSTPS